MLDFAISSPDPANDALGTCERSSLGSLSTWGADASAVPPYRNSSSSSIVDASAALDMTRLLGRLLARNERGRDRVCSVVASYKDALPSMVGLRERE